MEVVVRVLLFLSGGTMLKSNSPVHTTFGQYAFDPSVLRAGAVEWARSDPQGTVVRTEQQRGESARDPLRRDMDRVSADRHRKIAQIRGEESPADQ